MKKNVLILLVAFPFLAASCQMNPSPKHAPSDEWEPVSENYTRRIFSNDLNGRSISFIVYRAKSTEMQVSVFHSDEPKRFEVWREEFSEGLLINGGYFDELHQPTGNLIINGDELSKHVYHSPNAAYLLILDGIPEISQVLPQMNRNLSALQSFPLLIDKGEPIIYEDSGLLARRTIVAEDEEGFFYVIVFERSLVTLFEAAELLAERLPLQRALNLDGGTSTAVSAQFEGFTEMLIPLIPLPQVVLFSENPQD